MLHWAVIVLQLILTAIIIGGIVYYFLGIIAAKKLIKRRPKAFMASSLGISILKPLKGVEDGLKEYLTSFYLLDYPKFEIIFAVHTKDDPAVEVVNKLISHYPQVKSRLVIAENPPYANAKVYSLEQMAKVATFDILVITDSDTSVAKDYLNAIAEAFQSEKVGAMTNLYRGVAANDFWSKLEALGMSSEFMSGVIVAEWLEGMKFTLGPSMAIRKSNLAQIGGFAAMADFLADDFVLGNWVAEKGAEVVLSTHVINHHATSPGFLLSFKHRLRWNRSTRFSRPSGYIGQGFTYGLSWAFLGIFLLPFPYGLFLFLFTLIIRWFLAIQVGVYLLEDKTIYKYLFLIPLQDFISFASWLGGFLGSEISWRNRRFRIVAGGRFIPIEGEVKNELS
ncbi:MAG: glycosyltransferase [Blastocatellia bacterium]|nr:glycosyltransferase [Blastocatellia bacterium]MBL8194125.1 glycosyltransferase [Blastocatellia bacterium]MBN8722069.1 glycosyltransferase [Acidobacteriota bacterium]